MTINKTKAVSYGIGIAAFCSLLALALFWMLQNDWSSQRGLLASGQQLIVISYSSGYIPGVIAGLATLAVLFLALTLLLFAGSKGQQYKSGVIKFCSVAIILSLVSVFAGKMFFSNSWDTQAQQQGYKPCPGGTLLSNRLTYTAWVRNETLCYSPEIRRVISRGTPEETQQVERILQIQLKRQQAQQQ